MSRIRPSRSLDFVPRESVKPSFLDVLLLEVTRITENLKAVADRTNCRICSCAVDPVMLRSRSTCPKHKDSGRIAGKMKATRRTI